MRDKPKPDVEWEDLFRLRKCDDVIAVRHRSVSGAAELWMELESGPTSTTVLRQTFADSEASIAFLNSKEAELVAAGWGRV